MSGHSQRMRRKAEAYKGFRDKAREIGENMGRALGLSPDIIDQALDLYEEHWQDSPRTPQGTMVDCLYYVANTHGARTTTRKFYKKLKEQYGVGTEPRPSWLQCGLEN
jgi:hypothetical protein